MVTCLLRAETSPLYAANIRLKTDLFCKHMKDIIKAEKTTKSLTHQTEHIYHPTNPVVSTRSARILLLHKVPQVVIVVEIEE